MRLNTERIKATRQVTRHFSGTRAELWLSGSRVKDQRGFTLVELITVMAIIGIIAVAALPRFFDNNVFQAHGSAAQAMAALRYGQKVAIAQHRNVNVNITAAADSNCGSVLTGGDVSCVISNRVVVAPALPQTVTFNALGQRVNATASITVGTIAITIEAETGYVH